MAYWFIRVKHNPELAEKHSIVMIGYGIDEDITDEGKEGIRKHFSARTGIYKLTENEIGAKTRLVHSFINIVETGDIIISPFGKDYFRIGKIISDCGTVESLFKGSKQELKSVLANGHQLHEEVKPARKVEWLPKKISTSEIPNELNNLFKSMRPTINRIKLEGTEHEISLKFALKNLIEIKQAEVEADEKKKYNFLRTAFTVFGTTIITAIITKIFDTCAESLVCGYWVVALLLVMLFIYIAHKYKFFDWF